MSVRGRGEDAEGMAQTKQHSSLCKLEKEEAVSLKPPKERQPHRQLDFSPGTPVLSFHYVELSDNKCALF